MYTLCKKTGGSQPGILRCIFTQYPIWQSLYGTGTPHASIMHQSRSTCNFRSTFGPTCLKKLTQVIFEDQWNPQPWLHTSEEKNETCVPLYTCYCALFGVMNIMDVCMEAGTTTVTTVHSNAMKMCQNRAGVTVANPMTRLWEIPMSRGKAVISRRIWRLEGIVCWLHMTRTVHDGGKRISFNFRILGCPRSNSTPSNPDIEVLLYSTRQERAEKFPSYVLACIPLVKVVLLEVLCPSW